MNRQPMVSISSFTQLRTWQNAKELAVMMYRLSDRFPAAERFGLASQLQRAGVSVAANIAEGSSRNTIKDKNQFYSVALGSLTEVMSHLYIVRELGYCDENELQLYLETCENTHKMIRGLMKSSQERRP